MSKAIAEIAIGAGLIALDILLPAVGVVVSAAVLSTIAAAGASLVVGGVGTLLTKQQTGLGTTVRNPIAPWNVIYGRAKVGGTTVFIESTGESDKYLHMIFVLACHPCQSVDALLMDNQRVILDSNGNSIGSPTQWTANISHIVRTGDVVSVTLATPFVGLEDGDSITIKNVTGDLTLNGTFAVSVVNSYSFNYVCGGNPAIVDNAGQAVTNWPDYGDTIHMEVALGNQSPGSPPFPGLLATDGTGSNGLWTPQHLLQGKTAVYLRLKYGGNTYASGLPSIAFLASGKNDIYDPRTNTRGYSQNAALCIADYLAHPVFGYKASYGTEIPAGPLASAANICDESVELAAQGGAVYDVYRVVGYVTGKIATGITAVFFNDTGFVGDGTSPPAGQGLAAPTISTWTMINGVATQQPGGSTTYSYVVVAKSYGGTVLAVSTVGTTHTGDNVLSGNNYNAVVWNAFTKVVEPRYTCNGGFQLSTKRGEVLQNLLTSCAGRITYVGGQFYIWPAAWTGPSAAFSTGIPTNANGSPVTSGTLTVWATFTNTTGAPATPVVAAFAGVPTDRGVLGLSGPSISSIAQNDFLTLNLTGISGSVAQFSASLDPYSQVPLLPVLNIGCFIQGTLLALNELSTFNIYDCYVDLVYADSTTARIRATSASYGNTLDPTAGLVTNAQNALDADSTPPTTFASIARTSYGGLQSAGFLLLNGFEFPGAAGVVTTGVGLNDLSGPFQWKSTPTIRDLYNGVKGVYVCPANHWQSSDIPPYAQDSDHGYTNGPAQYFHDANLAADGGDRRWLEIQLPFTISTAAAQRIAKIELLRHRQKGTGTFPFNLSMYQLTALDVVAFTFPLMGWTNKLLEVSQHRFTVNKQGEKEGGATILGTELDLKETDPSVYEWSASEELSAQGYQQTPTNTVRTIAAPTGVTAVSNSGTAAAGSDGVSTSTVVVTWTPPTDGWVTNGGSVIVQYQIVGASTWTGLGNYDPSTTSATINGVTDGTQYNVRAAFVNLAGVQSAWTQFGPVTAGGSSFNPHFVYNETPAGALDGVNQTYTLAHPPNPANSLYVVADGIQQLQGIDYSLSGNTITFLQAIWNDAQGDWILASYAY